jgi:hypothetical protein
MKALLDNFLQTSTVAGLHYAFQPRQNLAGRCFWLTAIIALAFLGFWLSLENYFQWKSEPVVTTISSAGLPIEEVEFPSVVICSKGLNQDAISAVIWDIAFSSANLSIEKIFGLSPLQFSKVLNKNVRLNL